MTLCLLVFLVSSIAYCVPEADPDLWGHLQFGRDSLAHGLASTTTYSFTANGYPWINHENLSEIVGAWVVDHWGIHTLSLLRLGLGIALLVSIYRHAKRNRVTMPVIAGTILVTSAGLASFWQLRPQLLSFACFLGLILILNRAFAGWPSLMGKLSGVNATATDKPHRSFSQPDTSCLSFSRLWWCLPLFLIWTNAHGGFVAGLAICGAYFGLRCCEALVMYRQQAGKIVGGLILIGIAILAITFINPYGINLHRWLLESLSVPRPEITEWHPFTLQDEAFVPYALLSLMTLLGLALNLRRIDITQTAILGITLWQATCYQRHFPFFVILAAFWMPPHWQSLWARYQARRPEEEPQPPVIVERGLAILSTVMCLFLTATIIYRATHLHVRKSIYPVSAVGFMSNHNLQGRLVVTYNWAQYLIGVMGTRDEAPGNSGIEVAFDGRFRTCYPDAIVDEHFDFVHGDVPEIRNRTSGLPLDPTAVLRRNQPELVLICRKQQHSIQTMENEPDWSLLYQDGLAQLWGKRDIFDDPNSARFFPTTQRQISDAPQLGAVHWPGMPESERLISTPVAESRQLPNDLPQHTNNSL